MHGRRNREIELSFVDEKIAGKIDQVLDSQKPYESGLNFFLYGNDIAIDPESTDGDTDHRFIGGLGITGRSMKGILTELPLLKPVLDQETGRIVFLGNGFSDAPIEIAERFNQGLLSEPPVIVDVFDYEKVWRDFARIGQAFVREGLEIPTSIARHEPALRKLVQAKRQGILEAIQYYVGSGKIPSRIANAALVINCFGPNSLSLPEQIAMLKAEGRYFYIGLDGKKVI